MILTLIYEKLFMSFKYKEGYSKIRYAGDILQILLPLFTILNIKTKRKFVKNFLKNQINIELIKRISQVERPDGTNNLSFPSGHMGSAYYGARYLVLVNDNFKGNMKEKLLYVLALFVGYSRVHSNKHSEIDILGSILLAELELYILEKKNKL